MTTETWAEREARIMRMVMELMADWPPQSNIAPVRDLVDRADAYGWKIVPKASDKSSV